MDCIKIIKSHPISQQLNQRRIWKIINIIVHLRPEIIQRRERARSLLFLPYAERFSFR